MSKTTPRDALPLPRDGLSKETTDCLKGILAVFILLHHLYQYAGSFSNGVVGLLLQVTGYLCVSVFLFLSGYGLMYSADRKGQVYVRTLLRRRILPLWGYYLFLFVLYAVIDLVYFKVMGVPSRAGTALIRADGSLNGILLLQSLLFGFGDSIVRNGWYLQVILLFYVAFWLVCTLFSSNRGRIAGMTVFTALYMGVCIVLGVTVLDDQPNVVYEGVPCLLLGMLWYRFRPALRATFDRVYKLCLAGGGLLVLFAGVMMARFLVRNGGAERGVLDLSLKVLSALLFAAFAVCAVQVIPIRCGLTRWLGKISLEIYTLQGVFFILFSSPVIDSLPVRWVAVTAATLAAAWAVHTLRSKVLRRRRSA